MPITYRSEKGSPLTNAEVDGNFRDLDQRATANQQAATTAQQAAEDAGTAAGNVGTALVTHKASGDHDARYLRRDVSDTAPLLGGIAQAGVTGLPFELDALRVAVQRLRYADLPLPVFELQLAGAKVLDPRVKFTRDSAGLYHDAYGVLRAAAANEPRFDHDPETGAPRGLLLEQGATNLAWYSYYQPGDIWVGNATYKLEANVGLAPDGTNTLSRISALADGQPYAGPGATTSVSYVAGRKYVSSCWFQVDPSGPANQVRLLMHGNAFGNSKILLFNCQTGQVIAGTSQFAPEKWGYKRYPNNMVLLWQVNTATVTTSTYAPLIWFNAAIQAGDGVNFWGIDVKEQAFPSSHIPTRGSAVSIAADFVRVATDSWLNADAATLLSESDQDDFDTDINRYIMFLSANETTAGANYDGPLRRNGKIYINASAVDGADTPSISIPAGDIVKQRLAWTYQVGSPWVLAVNGQSVSGASGLPAPRTLSWLKFGGAGNAPVGSNWLRRVAVFPRALSAAQLEQLTA